LWILPLFGLFSPFADSLWRVALPIWRDHCCFVKSPASVHPFCFSRFSWFLLTLVALNSFMSHASLEERPYQPSRPTTSAHKPYMIAIDAFLAQKRAEELGSAKTRTPFFWFDVNLEFKISLATGFDPSINWSNDKQLNLELSSFLFRLLHRLHQTESSSSLLSRS
jgi:hypothetical protein